METTLLAKIKQLRKEKNYSQNEMADMLNMAKETYRDIESGRNSLKVDVFLSICRVLKIKPELLVKESDEIIVVLNREQAEAINELNDQIQKAINFNNFEYVNGDVIIGTKIQKK